jgi:CheY-like chemotaxis protein
MTRKMAPSIKDTPPKAVFSAAQTVGQGREIPYGRRNPSFKDYADVIVALVCLTAMAGTIYFAELDGNYATAMRMTAVIQRVFLVSGSAGNAVDTRKTILVVENDEGQRLIAKTALERYGYNVALVENGAQALTLLRNSAGRVALVLLDVRSSGTQIMQQLKGVRPSVPILVSEAAGEKLQPGAAGRVEKPFSALPLAEAVQHTLGPRPL